jgi:gamma-glutamylcyclotransferase (GGCT)/AIG2-like uncharacterized protein YtfP
MTRVFVYGTLMRGERAQAYLARARFVRIARTEPAFTLVSLGRFPALLAGGTTSVRGELYDVGDDLLAALDFYEGVPSLYRRVLVRLRGGGSAHAYVLARGRQRRDPVLATGNWKDHHAD